MYYISKTKKDPLLVFNGAETLASPHDALVAGKEVIHQLTKTLPEEKRQIYGQSIVYEIVSSYWSSRFLEVKDFRVPSFLHISQLQVLDELTLRMAKDLGLFAAKLDVIEASYLIGNIYTATIPEDKRATNGIYYTPPNLTARLLDLAEKSGVDWQTATVLDPACGGGAFLAPVALRIVSTLKQTNPNHIISHVEKHLKGYEIDAFSAWLSQVFVEIALSKYSIIAGRRPNSMIDVIDSLDIKIFDSRFDLIIGNPPYGKIKLLPERRKRYSESLYGHANLYGLFVHLGFDLVKPGGIIAYVTPTGFLGGEYFKNLRAFICKKGKPVEFDFVRFRKGIFDDVLQETMLATYKADTSNNNATIVNEIIPLSEKKYEAQCIGQFLLPEDPSIPWILSRHKNQSDLIRKLSTLSYRLSDWGYEVKTGPLVWNRHKEQLKSNKGKHHYPLIWAEAITPMGEFIWRAYKKNHTLFFQYKEGDDWLFTDEPCIILQRTTAKEQQRRLISALLTEEFIGGFGKVVIENHLNIIKPTGTVPVVPMTLLHLFLNSLAADNVFRCISGSVAVSAYELENMPLPSPEQLMKILKKEDKKNDLEKIEKAFLSLYE